MKLSELSKGQKITIVSAIILSVILIMLFLFMKPNNKYGKEVGINNYDKYISNLPTDRRDSINSTLYNIIKSNLKSGDPSVKDATIRKDSVINNYDSTTNINSGTFIVDIPSIKQSYSIYFEWSTDVNNVNLSGYTAAASCLPADKLIYGDFGCIDDFTKTNTGSLIILDYLPYSTFNYTITARINDSNKVDLNVDMVLYSADTHDGNRDNSINKYKTEIIDWIKSKNLNPVDYVINYNIN